MGCRILSRRAATASEPWPCPSSGGTPWHRPESSGRASSPGVPLGCSAHGAPRPRRWRRSTRQRWGPLTILGRAPKGGGAAAIARLQRPILERLDAASPLLGALPIPRTGGRSRSVTSRDEPAVAAAPRAALPHARWRPAEIPRPCRLLRAPTGSPRTRAGSGSGALPGLFGDADQAHLAREFRSSAARSPAHLVAPLNTGWMPGVCREVAFLQDGVGGTSRARTTPVAGVGRRRVA